MKKLFYVALIFAAFACNQKKIDRMQFVQDSIQQVAAEKDSTMSGFVSMMNDIQENLDSIKQMESVVKLQMGTGQELKKDSKAGIMEDIRVIHELLMKNKQLVIQLQKNLDSSEHKVGGLQKTIWYLHKQIESKDKEIASLNTELEKLHLDMLNLSRELKKTKEEGAVKEGIIANREQTIQEQQDQLYTGYYVYGTQKELIENGVIEKEGGVLGIGRTLTFRQDFNPDVFNKVDIRELKGIKLDAKKAQVITPHASDSYKFIRGKVVEGLEITDPAKFWETSKYLVIVVN